jgi:hypothetical protein
LSSDYDDPISDEKKLESKLNNLLDNFLNDKYGMVLDTKPKTALIVLAIKYIKLYLK